jgi:hypothetical protein
MADDDVAKLFTEAGYTYPGTPAVGVALLLSELKLARETADTERVKYATLLADLDVALEDSPLSTAPQDPVRHARLLCKSADAGRVAMYANAVRTLRARHPGESKAYADDDEFLFALDGLTERSDERMASVVNASIVYWRALRNATNHAELAAALVQWSEMVSSYLDED